MQDIVSCKMHFFADLPAMIAFLQAHDSQPPTLAPNPSLSKWIRMSPVRTLDFSEEE